MSRAGAKSQEDKATDGTPGEGCTSSASRQDAAYKGEAWCFFQGHIEIKHPQESQYPEQSSWKWRLAAGRKGRVEKEEVFLLFFGLSEKNNLSTSSFSCKDDYPVCSSIFKEGAWQGFERDSLVGIITTTLMERCRPGAYDNSTYFMGLVRPKWSHSSELGLFLGKMRNIVRKFMRPHSRAALWMEVRG